MDEGEGDVSEKPKLLRLDHVGELVAGCGVLNCGEDVDRFGVFDLDLLQEGVELIGFSRWVPESFLLREDELLWWGEVERCVADMLIKLRVFDVAERPLRREAKGLAPSFLIEMPEVVSEPGKATRVGPEVLLERRRWLGIPSRSDVDDCLVFLEESLNPSLRPSMRTSRSSIRHNLTSLDSYLTSRKKL